MNWKPEKREPCVIFVLHLHSLVFSPQPRFAQLKRQFMIVCNFRFAAQCVSAVVCLRNASAFFIQLFWRATARRKRSHFSICPSLQSTRWRAAAYASTQSESELRRSRRSKFLFRSRLNFDAPPRSESMPRHRSYSRTVLFVDVFC